MWGHGAVGLWGRWAVGPCLGAHLGTGGPAAAGAELQGPAAQRRPPALAPGVGGDPAALRRPPQPCGHRQHQRWDPPITPPNSPPTALWVVGGHPGGQAPPLPPNPIMGKDPPKSTAVSPRGRHTQIWGYGGTQIWGWGVPSPGGGSRSLPVVAQSRARSSVRARDGDGDGDSGSAMVAVAGLCPAGSYSPVGTGGGRWDSASAAGTRCPCPQPRSQQGTGPWRCPPKPPHSHVPIGVPVSPLKSPLGSPCPHPTPAGDRQVPLLW